MKSENYDLKGKSVLILDDNQITRDSLKYIFEARGATAYTAGYLEKGAATLQGLVSKNSAPNLIITDVNLPGVYGFEVLQKIEDALRGQKVPLLLMSRRLSDFALRRASLYGVVGYARKPVLTDALFVFAVEIIMAFDKTKKVLAKVPDEKVA